MIASPAGSRLFVTVGSNSNVGENGRDAEAGRGAIWKVRLPGGEHHLYATGLRNPNGMAFTDDSMLWTVVNERDEIGSDLVPDHALGAHTACLGLANAKGNSPTTRAAQRKPRPRVGNRASAGITRSIVPSSSPNQRASVAAY